MPVSYTSEETKTFAGAPQAQQEVLDQINLT